MRRLTSLLLLLTTIAFIVSCTKNPEPPALGDRTNPETNNPGKNDAKKVLSLGNNWGDIFQTGPKGRLYVRNGAKIIKVYTPDDKGVFGDGLAFPGDPWEASLNMFYMGVAQDVETFMVVNEPPYGGLFRFDIKSDGLLDIHPTTNAADPWPNNFGFWYGDGWHKYDVIAFNGKYVFQIAHEEGETLYRSAFQEFTDDWSTWNRASTISRENTGLKFDQYRAAMVMKNSLLIVNKDGDLMAYAIDETGKPDAGKKIGKGWKIYKKVVATGNDILAVDNKGDVYRYTIDLTKTTNDADEP